jgi:hypothetical protein
MQLAGYGFEKSSFGFGSRLQGYKYKDLAWPVMLISHQQRHRVKEERAKVET